MGKLKKVIKEKKQAAICGYDADELPKGWLNPYLRWVQVGSGYYAAENELRLTERALCSMLELTADEEESIDLKTVNAVEEGLTLHEVPAQIDYRALEHTRGLLLETGYGKWHLVELEDGSWAALDERFVEPCYRPRAQMNYTKAPNGIGVYADGVLVGVVERMRVAEGAKNVCRDIIDRL